MNRGRLPPGRLFFLLPTKERTKENCRCFDAVRGCARGATVERSETGERTMIAPAGQSTARACLRSKLAALVVRRQAGSATWGLHAPKNPKAEVGRPDGYADAVLLSVLNAVGPSSAFESGVPPNPLGRNGFYSRVVCRGRACPARDLTGLAFSGLLPPFQIALQVGILPPSAAARGLADLHSFLHSSLRSIPRNSSSASTPYNLARASKFVVLGSALPVSLN